MDDRMKPADHEGTQNQVVSELKRKSHRSGGTSGNDATQASLCRSLEDDVEEKGRRNKLTYYLQLSVS